MMPLTDYSDGADKTAIAANIDVAIGAVTAQASDLAGAGHVPLTIDCATLYCTASLLAGLDYFRARGWTVADGGVAVAGDPLSTSTQAERQFGDDAYMRLFSPRGCSCFDYARDGRMLSISDRELALHRLRRQRLALVGDADALWSVKVGNVGTVYCERNEAAARDEYRIWSQESDRWRGRAGGEPVALLRNGVIELEFEPAAL